MLPTSAEYRKTGHEAVAPRAGTAQPKAESAPAKKQTPSEPADDAGESAAASEAGNDPKQEKREAKPRSNAESRLKEVLEDLKRAGLTPAELKNFKREAQKAEAAEAPKTEHTEKPAAPKQPTYEDAHPKPKLEDFDSIEAHTEALTDWKLDKREFERAAREAAQAQQKAISDKLTDAKARYGDDAETSIRSAAKTIAESAEVPGAVKAVLTDSPVLVDVLYTLNSKEGELESFLELAKTNPAAAIRKAVLLEHLVSQELSFQSPSQRGDGRDSSIGDPARDESGKFVSQKLPAKRVTEAPPPPREASGRSAAPPDEQQAAFKSGDFATFRNARNRADVARQQGR
jgi:hypothetical protein